MQSFIKASWPLAKQILFRMDPEDAHHFTLKCLKYFPLVASNDSDLPKNLLGLHFKNPVGLAAGMDKNAECLHAWETLGFGFAEIGTVTAHPQKGNPKPRLFRLLEDQALYNRMGFNNDGAKAISKRMETQRKKHNISIPIGTNLGKSAITSLEDAPKDYLTSFNLLADFSDYITINVSSPNTKDLRKLQQVDELSRILKPVCTANSNRRRPLPIFVKLAPDLMINDAIRISKGALDNGADGLIISNTTINPKGVTVPDGGGGLSGAPIFDESTSMLKSIRQAVGDTPAIIGSGGIMSPSQALEKMQKGADLVQIYSGLVYNGPGFIGECVKALKT